MVRPAKPADVPAMLTLIRELAAYEREPDAVTMTAEQLSDALFRSHPHLFGHVVEVDGAVVGLALWFLNFSTWEGTHGVYLEDLYVVPSMRGNGAGVTVRPLPNSSKTPLSTGSIAAKTSSCVTKLISKSS